MIPRPADAGVAMTDPIRPCNRFDPTSCPTGQTCDVLARLFEGDTQFSLYSGCVKAGRERGLNDPCDGSFTNNPPYETEGLTDLVFRDHCGPGLICGIDVRTRGAQVCRPACSLVQTEQPVLCDDPKDFCVGDQQFLQFCISSDGCDVTTQTGCRPGEGCYLRLNESGTGFLSICFPQADELLADYEPCQAYNVCRPGSSCMGPLTKPPTAWRIPEDLECRPVCNMDGTLAEDDSDGGVPGGAGTCDAPRQCTTFASTGLDLSTMSKPPYGQCN